MTTNFWTAGATMTSAFFAGTMLVLSASNADATVLFSSPLQTNASLTGEWGAPGNSGSAIIVSAPGGGNALTFGKTYAGGDLFTRDAFTSTTRTFALTFDYLGACGHSSECGAFVGASGGTPSGQGWILSDTPIYPNIPNSLPDTGRWEHVSYVFGGATTNLFLEDFSGSSYGGAGAIYFKNFLLTDNPSGLPVGTISYAAGIPEPATWAMMLVGFGGLGGVLRGRRETAVKAT